MFAAACLGDSTSSRNAGAMSPSPSAAGKTLPYAGAPKVEHPLPESVLSALPCDGALTPDQLHSDGQCASVCTVRRSAKRGEFACFRHPAVSIWLQ